MRNTRTENPVVYYTNMWDENVPQTDVDVFCRWAEETNTKIIWEWSYALPIDSYPLWDRGYSLIRNENFSYKAYEELKALFGVPADVRVGFSDLEKLYWALGGKNEPHHKNQFTESKEVTDD